MKKIIYVAAGALLAIASYGQGPVGGPPDGRFGPGPFGPRAGFGGHWGKVVTGAQYSATVTSQFTQGLDGGNTIQRTNTAQVARDSQGRTYEQQTITTGRLAQNGPITLTFLFDPVAGYSYSLNPQTKVATRHVMKTPATGQNAPAFRHPEASGSGNANRTVTDLGTQTINGVTAQGKSITRTIPVGSIGNAQPIVSTDETWYSPDLQIVVLAKRNDPLTGQSTYTVSNIQRTEPPSTLFQVPSDYTVQDATDNHAFRGSHGPGGPPPPPER